MNVDVNPALSAFGFVFKRGIRLVVPLINYRWKRGSHFNSAGDTNDLRIATITEALRLALHGRLIKDEFFNWVPSCAFTWGFLVS